MKYALASALAIALLSQLPASAITIDTVTVGNPGNPGRIQGGIFGSVSTTYKIATTEVTNAQYVLFLNSVAATDSFGLYNTNMSLYTRGGILRSGSSGSYTYNVKPDVPDGGPDLTNYTYGDKPVNFVSWYDAARFANWVNNGATSGASTETGAYTMSVGVGVSRNTNATWFLPTENQWYKAAYYNGTTATYSDYATGSNTAPDNNIPDVDSGNSANYFSVSFTQNQSYPTTSVGAYTLTHSSYGTFDQSGNVWEWTEAYNSSTSTRVRRGGGFDSYAVEISAATRENRDPTSESENTGFRLASLVAPAGVPGDYNNNGVVDTGDYVLWRRLLGQSVILPNDSTPGTVTGADYTVWRGNFGKTPSAAGAGELLNTAIPEPTALCLGVLGILSLTCGRPARKVAASQYPRLY